MSDKSDTFDEDMRDEGNPFGEPNESCDGHPLHIALPLTVVRVPVTSPVMLLFMGVLIGVMWTLVIDNVLG
jgi:hypothetical protein